MSFQIDKFQELIVYIADQCADDSNFGATKLNKILFYADFLSYGQRGLSITLQKYQKLPNGPAPRGMLPASSALTADGSICVREVEYHGRTQRRTVANRKANLSVFDEMEIEIVQRVIRDLWNKNANQVSALSHEFVGWQLADDKEDIPYETVLVSRSVPSDAERSWVLGYREDSNRCKAMK